MATLYGFFVPDRECCVDLEGMVGYLHEKVKLGHYCLHCQRVFSTAAGTIQHMRDSGHTKLRYEEGVDLEEFDVFYDFEEANKEYLGGEVPDDMSDGEAPPALGSNRPAARPPRASARLPSPWGIRSEYGGWS